MLTASELAADIRRTLSEQGWDPGERSAREMADGILDYERTHPDRACTPGCGCMTMEELMASLGMED